MSNQITDVAQPIRTDTVDTIYIRNPRGIISIKATFLHELTGVFLLEPLVLVIKRVLLITLLLYDQYVNLL